MEVYFGGAEDMGITEEEMSALRAMVMAVSAGRIFFQSKTLVEKMQTAGRDEEAGQGSSPTCCD